VTSGAPSFSSLSAAENQVLFRPLEIFFFHRPNKRQNNPNAKSKTFPRCAAHQGGHQLPPGQGRHHKKKPMELYTATKIAQPTKKTNLPKKNSKKFQGPGPPTRVNQQKFKKRTNVQESGLVGRGTNRHASCLTAPNPPRLDGPPTLRGPPKGAGIAEGSPSETSR